MAGRGASLNVGGEGKVVSEKRAVRKATSSSSSASTTKREKSKERVVREKTPTRAKSPARPKSPGRSKSPSRTKIPVAASSPENVVLVNTRSKSPARQKSPSRRLDLENSRSRSPVVIINPLPNITKRSPIKSSSVLVKETKTSSVVTKTSTKIQDQAPSRSAKYNFDLDSDSDAGERFESKETKPKATVKGTRKTTQIDAFEKDIEEVSNYSTSYNKDSYNSMTGPVTRRSTRLQESRIVHLKSNDNDLSAYTKLSEFSDDEKPVEEKTPQVPYAGGALKKSTSISALSFFDKTFAFFLLLTLPLFYVFLHLLCNENTCSFNLLIKKPDSLIENYMHLNAFIDPISVFITLGFAMIVAIFSAIPFGGKKVLSGGLNRQGKLSYVMNGWLCCFFLSLCLFGLEFGLKIPAAKFVRTHYLQLNVASTLLAIIISIFLYIRSFYVPVSVLNPYAVTDNKIYNFVMGKETNPRIFGQLDLKFFFFRLGCSAIVILNLCLLIENFNLPSDDSLFTNPLQVLKNLKLNWTFLTLAFMQTFYLCDYFIFEDTFVTSFENMYEGLGLMLCVFYACGGFIYTLPLKFVFEYGIQLSNLTLILSLIPFFAGYVLTRSSISQKHLFRQNPYHPRVAHLETIPTGQGKKLIVSGLWGFVRHPNHLGDILMYTAWLPFVFFYPPIIVPLISIVFLVHRSHRDGARCKERYGQAWDRYTQRVPHVLIPKVY